MYQHLLDLVKTSHNNLNEHFQCFFGASNFAKRLRALRGLKVYDGIVKCWGQEQFGFIKVPKRMFAEMKPV